jgi:F0F1-type ATP synthase membrane subunit b/b'
VNDSWIRDRAWGMYKETPRGRERGTDPDAEWAAVAPRVARAGRPEQTDVDPAGDVPRALQVLASAQRTAEEHVAGARRQADRIRADARATAEQVLGDARARADAVRREADKTLSDARAGAAQTARDAQAHTDNARREGDRIVSDARARAAETARDAQADADRLKRRGELRYEEMVGNLETTREALQQQIEALQEFDRDHRVRLLTFVQAQLGALWVDEPHVEAGIEQPGGVAPSRLPAHRPGSWETQPGEGV